MLLHQRSFYGIAPPTKQFLHVFAKEAAGINTDRTVYGAASASASSFVVHHTQQISMAAVAGDADNINKQARKMRTNWVNSPECQLDQRRQKKTIRCPVGLAAKGFFAFCFFAHKSGRRLEREIFILNTNSLFASRARNPLRGRA